MQPSETQNFGIEDQPALGEIKVNHSVIASIVRLAATQVKGVSGVGGGLRDGMAELLAIRESDRGVKIQEEESGNYRIELRVVITYGAEIGRTAFDVQMAVREQVSHMTGKNVNRVDVIIDGVKLPQPDKVASNESARDDWPHMPATD